MKETEEMTRKILPPQERKAPVAPSWKQELLTDNSCQVYPRVSTPEQKKNVSAEMQQDKSFAIICGWIDATIIMDTEDLGLSGQLKMEERPAFVKMLRNIASGEVKTVIAAQVDRLFRDRWGAEYSKFMEICYIYGVKVVTPNSSRTGIDFIYDFSIPWHVEKFRRKCEEAWSFLENHIYGRMLAAARELGEHGFWSGGRLPIGYIVDRRERVDGKKNPNYRKYIIYEPHAKVVRWLFERFRELAGQTNQLLREIDRMGVLFPLVDGADEELIAEYANKRILSEDGQTLLGYTIASSYGLRSLLSNPVYVGYWVYNNVVVSANNHDAIVEDYGAFLYAYNRLSAWHLDGSPNESFLERQKKYVKKYKADQPGLLKNHLEASDPDTYAIHVSEVRRIGKKAPSKVVVLYGFWPRKSSLKSCNYLVPAADPDDFFLQRFIERLQQANGFECFLDQERAEQQAQIQLQQDTERDLKAAIAHMKRIEEQVNSGKLTNPELLEKANTTYTKLQEDVARLRIRLNEVTTNKTHAQKRRTYQQLMQEAGERWDTVVDFETLILMVDLFVQKVVLTPLTPRFYTLSVHWLDPEWGIDEALCWRGGNPSLRWSEEEDALLKQHYLHASREELLHLIPARSFAGMIARAQIFGLRRQVVEPTEIPITLSWQDYQAMQEQGLAEQESQASNGRKTPRWTAEEDEQLRALYPGAPRAQLQQAIAARSYDSMCHRARTLGLSRREREPETGVPRTMCWQDYQLMLEHGVTETFLFGEEGGKLIGWYSRPRQTFTFFDTTSIVTLLQKILRR